MEENKIVLRFKYLSVTIDIEYEVGRSNLLDTAIGFDDQLCEMDDPLEGSVELLHPTFQYVYKGKFRNLEDDGDVFKMIRRLPNKEVYTIHVGTTDDPGFLADCMLEYRMKQNGTWPPLVTLIMERNHHRMKMSWNNSSPTNQRKCNCGLPLAKLTSWTNENPGRKFLACKFYDPKTETRGCKAFEWVDNEDGTDWQRVVINQLLLDKKLMKGEINSLKRDVDDLTGQRRCLLNEVDTLQLKCKALTGDRKKLIRSSGCDNKLQVYLVVLCSVLLVVLGYLVMNKMV
ncbi:uncharacterized protein LOC110708797 [Chenopodium quinoa]|uniref:uncharacterized protein LOC110708797 n=1 Tax=Chenopodium quinoa TaxID=63459 RepID=UPI000B79399D|nr:uncharacterized protein LOC110708797 [Chenopodium quinoa]